MLSMCGGYTTGGGPYSSIYVGSPRSMIRIRTLGYKLAGLKIRGTLSKKDVLCEELPSLFGCINFDKLQVEISARMI